MTEPDAEQLAARRRAGSAVPGPTPPAELETAPWAGGMLRAIAAEAGLRRVRIVAWRDVDDPGAGGSELHAHRIASHWAAAGVHVELRTSAVAGGPPVVVRDGYTAVRRSGRYAAFARTAPEGALRRPAAGGGLVGIWRGAPFWAPLLDGWTATGIVTLQSGMPFTVYEPNDVSLTGSSPEVSGYSANRPNLVGNPNNGPHTVAEWFNVNAFQRLNPVTQAGQFGSEGRNVVTGPGLADWDFSLLRTIALAESRSLQFRAEVFNFLNHPNFDLPNNMIGTPNFGAITEARNPRLVQLALRFRF